MLESSPMKRKSRNPWAFAISLLLQTLMIGALILIPLLYTEALPKQAMLTWLQAPPPPPPPPPPPAPKPVKRVVRRVVKLIKAGQLRAPREIPKEITMIKEKPEDDFAGVVGGVPGGVPGGEAGGVLGGVLGAPTAALPPPPTPKRIRVSSGVQEAKLTRKVLPVYPPIAKQARIRGTVRLEAIIGKDGAIRNLRVVQGHPLLVQAALQAVQQWRYEPTLLNNQPVEVVTIIDVIFRLN